jgi:hypothetical protein
MTRQAFLEAFAADTSRVTVREPFIVERCECGDVNCHGWKFVAVEEEPC